MSLTLKPGTRLFSAVCATEMIAVKAPADAVDLTIGGAPALDRGRRPREPATRSPTVTAAAR